MMSAKVPARSPSELVPRISSRFTSEMPRTWLIRIVELVELEPQGVGDLFLVGRAAEALLDLAVGLLELAALLADAARDPVEGAKLVEDRALDPELRIGLELAVLLGVVLLDRVHQADHAGVVEIVEIDVRGQPDGDAVDDVTDQWRVLEDDLLFQGRRNLGVLLPVPPASVFPSRPVSAVSSRVRMSCAATRVCRGCFVDRLWRIGCPVIDDEARDVPTGVLISRKSESAAISATRPDPKGSEIAEIPEIGRGSPDLSASDRRAISKRAATSRGGRGSPHAEASVLPTLRCTFRCRTFGAERWRCGSRIPRARRRDARIGRFSPCPRAA